MSTSQMDDVKRALSSRTVTTRAGTLTRWAKPLKFLQFFVVIYMISHVSACAWFYSARNDHTWAVLNEERDGCGPAS